MSGRRLRAPSGRTGGRTMKNTTRTFASCLAAVAAMSVASSRPAFAQGAQATAPTAAATPKPATMGLVVYPGKGQEAAKQAADENECYGWARQQTGIDPTAAPAAVAEAEKQRGGAVRGAARGAAKGAAVGAVGDDDRVRDDGN